MKKSFTAFISLGFPCNGPEAGEYGFFTVDLNDDEINKLDEIIKEETKGYKRFVVEARYPDLHNKIVSAATELVHDVLVHYSLEFLDEPISEEDENVLDAMSYHDQAAFIEDKYGAVTDTPDDLSVCYYLCDEELPNDFTTRSSR